MMGFPKLWDPIGRHTAQVFFCKYNDPSYVKLEKLEVMIKLASAANIDQVLMEFREYASEVDVDFVRKVRDTYFWLGFIRIKYLFMCCPLCFPSLLP